MHKLWKDIIAPIIEKTKPKHIVEIGADTGITTLNILEYCENNDSRLTSIDPLPKFDFGKICEKHGEKFEFYKDLSLNTIPVLNDFDMVLIDGDSNRYDAYNELELIENKLNEKFPMIFLHGTFLPYSPENEGEEKSVLDAVEDFIEQSSLDLSFLNIPAYDGLGILYLKNQDTENILENTIDYKAIMENLELNHLNEKNKIIQDFTKKDDENKNIIHLLNKEKTSLNNINIRRSKTIQQLNQEKTSLQQNNTEKDPKIQQLTQENTTLQQNNTEKDQKIQQLTQENTTLHETNIKKNDIIQELILEKTQFCESNDKKDLLIDQLSSQNETLMARAKTLTWSKKELYETYREQLVQLKKIKDDKKKLEQKIEKNNTKLSDLEVLEKEMIILKQTLEIQQNKVDQFESSTSWKITQPLRNMANKLRGLKNKLPKGPDAKK